MHPTSPTPHPAPAIASPRAVFDELTGSLEDYFSNNTRVIAEADAQLVDSILTPLRAFVGRNPSSKSGSILLQRIFRASENHFASIASTLSLDPWMSILRRFPQQPFWPIQWEMYLTAGLVRYSNLDHDSTIGTLRSHNSFGIHLSLTEQQILDAFQLAALARTMAQIAGVYRWVGKGARPRPTDRELLNVVPSPPLFEAVMDYERRRPRELFLHEEGHLVYNPTDDIGHPILLLPQAPYETRIHVPGPDLRLLCRYLPQFISGESILRTLRAYEEAIDEQFGVSVDAIAQVLCGIAVRTMHSIPPIANVSENTITLQPSDGSTQYNDNLDFLFGLCQKGFVRFPRDHWISTIADVKSPWSDDAPHRVELARQFFEAFTITRDRRASIDLSMLRPLPLVYESASDEVYFDCTATLDFLAWILEGAKEWYSTQHGDRFTLALKRWIEDRSDAHVLKAKEDIRTSDGGRAEIDLLVRSRAILYAVECKAYKKSRRFFRGDVEAVAQRRRKIAEAVAQAKAAAAVLRRAIHLGELELQDVNNVEWLVCTPTQEFVFPRDKYGFLATGQPRVCTPEELLSILA